MLQHDVSERDLCQCEGLNIREVGIQLTNTNFCVDISTLVRFFGVNIYIKLRNFDLIQYILELELLINLNTILGKLVVISDKRGIVLWFDILLESYLVSVIALWMCTSLQKHFHRVAFGFKRNTQTKRTANQ